MSKITQALNKAQQEIAKARAEKQTQKEQEPSLFLRELDNDLKEPSLFEAVLLRVAKYRWFLIVGLILGCAFIFAFGVTQGMKIEQTFGQPQSQPPRETVAAAPAVVSAITVDDAGRPVAMSSSREGEYKIIAPKEDEAVEEFPGPALEAPNGRYTLQLITYASRARAAEEVKLLQEKDFYAFIVPTQNHFQVCVNRFEKASDARNYLTKLSENGELKRYPGAFIRVVKNI